jgi:hypothetical protein
MSKTNEKVFEEAIEQSLIDRGGYIKECGFSNSDGENRCEGGRK